MQPYITIVMPVYNNEKYFPVAVNSIRSQTFLNWELVIVDDGSTDRTPEIADNLAGTDDRIRVIHQENQWIYKSFNNGIAAANGKYVLVVNSDDTLNPEALQRIYNVAEIDNADIVMFNLIVNECDEEQNIINADLDGWSKYMKSDFSYNDREKIHHEWCNFLKCKFIRHQCVYRTEIAKRVKYRTDIYGGDYYYNIQVADEINVAAGTCYVVYNYFQYRNNNMNASVGKYYGYEHSMFNECYIDFKNLLLKWNVYNNESRQILSKQRLQHLSTEIRSYQTKNCPLTVDEKLEKIFKDLSDRVVYECACEIDSFEEYQSRILSGLRELFIKEIPSADSPYYFMYELLDSLLRYEKDDGDMEKIRAGVYHPLNVNRIGVCFYDRIK